MKKTAFIFFMLSNLLVSCNQIEENHVLEIQKSEKRKAIIFANINKSWVFNATPANGVSQNLTTQWNEWRVFLDELSRKPKTSIGAFQQKTKNLSQKALDLKNNIPQQFKTSPIKSRIAVLITKINMLELYINLSDIPDKKVIEFITAINSEVASLQLQMNEIDIKSKIKSEDGEEELIKMMDTARAVPSNATLNISEQN